MHVRPLLNDLLGVRRLYNRIRAAVPDRDLWPRAMMLRCRSHAVTEGARREMTIGEHCFESFIDIFGAPIGKPSNDSSARKSPWIGCYHYDRHGAASRQAGHEYLLWVGAEFADGVFDNLMNRKRFAVTPCCVLRQKPGEAVLRVVSELLLRINNQKTQSIGKRGPPGAVIVRIGVLAATMQGDNHGGPDRQVFGCVCQHAQVARVRSKIRDGL